MDELSFKKMIEGESKEKEEFIKNTKTLWARDKGKNISIDSFNILKVLGKGAFGRVLLVEEKETGYT